MSIVGVHRVCSYGLQAGKRQHNGHTEVEFYECRRAEWHEEVHDAVRLLVVPIVAHYPWVVIVVEVPVLAEFAVHVEQVDRHVRYVRGDYEHPVIGEQQR